MSNIATMKDAIQACERRISKMRLEGKYEMAEERLKPWKAGCVSVKKKKIVEKEKSKAQDKSMFQKQNTASLFGSRWEPWRRNS